MVLCFGDLLAMVLCPKNLLGRGAVSLTCSQGPGGTVVTSQIPHLLWVVSGSPSCMPGWVSVCHRPLPALRCLRDLWQEGTEQEL